MRHLAAHIGPSTTSVRNNDVEIALRALYEVAREFAPYLGVLWNQSFGETGGIREAAAETASGISLVGGVPCWF